MLYQISLLSPDFFFCRISELLLKCIQKLLSVDVLSLEKLKSCYVGVGKIGVDELHIKKRYLRVEETPI